MRKLRECRVCGGAQPLGSYTKNGVQKGTQYYRHLCTSCYTKQKAERRQKTREWFEGVKSSMRCGNCGENHIACLAFHHNDPSQKDTCVADTIRRGWSKQRILDEMAKCRVLCSNCHLKLHWEERKQRAGVA